MTGPQRWQAGRTSRTKGEIASGPVGVGPEGMVAAGARRARALVGECGRSARSSRAFSTLFSLIAFLAALVVVALVGQAQAQRAGVAAEFERPEYRTVEVIDTAGAGVLPSSMTERAIGYSTVVQSWGLGPAFEVVNGAFPDRGRVAAHTFAGEWRNMPVRLIDGRWPNGPAEAIVSTESVRVLGIDASGGWVRTDGGTQWAVVGTFEPEHRRAPTSVLVPAAPGAPLRSVLITVRQLADVDLTTKAVAALAETTSSGQLTIDKSRDAADLRGAISVTVATYGSMIVVTTMATSFAVMALLSVLMVHARRQEFGRRRALGATRTTVVVLVLVQGAMVVAIGAALGAGVGAGITALRFGSGPDWVFLVVLLVTAVSGSAAAQLPSALAAGFRDPVRVLRMP